jgi:Ankyrin repeats (3 copies)
LEKEAIIMSKQLTKVAENGQTEDVHRLLETTGAKKRGIMIKDHLGMTPLHRACVYGHADTASLLIEKGAVIDDKNKIGWTPLYVFERAWRFLFDLSSMKKMNHESNKIRLCTNFLFWCFAFGFQALCYSE